MHLHSLLASPHAIWGLAGDGDPIPVSWPSSILPCKGSPSIRAEALGRDSGSPLGLLSRTKCGHEFQDFLSWETFVFSLPEEEELRAGQPRMQTFKQALWRGSRASSADLRFWDSVRSLNFLYGAEKHWKHWDRKAGASKNTVLSPSPPQPGTSNIPCSSNTAVKRT